MKLTTLGFGNGFKGISKVRSEAIAAEHIPPGYEWNPENLKRTPAKPPVPAVRQKQKKSKILPKMQQRWKKPTYAPGQARK